MFTIRDLILVSLLCFLLAYSDKSFSNKNENKNENRNRNKNETCSILGKVSLKGPKNGFAKPPPESMGPPYEIDLNRAGIRKEGSETKPIKSSYEARNEALYRVGIVKGQAPVYVFENGNIKQYFYEINVKEGSKMTVIVMHHGPDEYHKLPHWEVGIPKTSLSGKMDLGQSGERSDSYVYHGKNKIRVFYTE